MDLGNQDTKFFTPAREKYPYQRLILLKEAGANAEIMFKCSSSRWKDSVDETSNTSSKGECEKIVFRVAGDMNSVTSMRRLGNDVATASRQRRSFPKPALRVSRDRVVCVGR